MYNHLQNQQNLIQVPNLTIHDERAKRDKHKICKERVICDTEQAVLMAKGNQTT